MSEPTGGATARPTAEVQALLERFAAAGVPTYDRLTVAQARAQLEAVVKLQRPPPGIRRVDDQVVDGRTGRVPVRVYRPVLEPAPVVVYLHGGGFVLGSIAAADEPCRALAAESGCVVVSVEYRRAPEHPYPAAFRDAVDAIRWTGEQAAALGGDGRLVVLGDSAGGNLAAAAAAELRGTGLLAAQVLVYPTLAPASTTDFASYRDRADGPLMTRRELDWFWGHYLRDDGDATDPRAAPLHEPDLAGLPDTTVVVAELDPLRDEGRAYAHAARAAGVPTRTLEYRGMPHGFWWLDRVLPQAADLTATLVPVLRGEPSWSGTLTR